MINKQERIGEIKENNQGSYMKIIRYGNANDVDIEFMDDFHYRVYGTRYRNFKSGSIKNPYYPSVFGVGMIGSKYPSSINGKVAKEYQAWKCMLSRCFDIKYKERYPSYQDVTCCNDWLLYENFYEWLHSQENFDKWYNGKKWALDKDILIKGNKIYSPNTCCLVPQNINALFVKNESRRGSLPIGTAYIERDGHTYYVSSFSKKMPDVTYKYFKSPNESFIYYKNHKEFYIKQMAQIEFNNGNIIKACYEAMLNYEVEITD